MCGWGVGGRGWGEEHRLVCVHMFPIPMHMIVYSVCMRVSAHCALLL